MKVDNRFAIDNEILLEQSIRKRLCSVICGMILGEAKINNIDSVIDRLNDTAIYNKKYIKKINNYNLLKGIAPITSVFDESRDLNYIKSFLENYLKTANIKTSEKSGIIIYIEILYRLFHYDDYKRALDKTAEASENILINSIYKDDLLKYDWIINRKPVFLAEFEDGKDIFSYCLSQSLFCCMNNDTFEKTLSSVSVYSAYSDIIGAITGAMAGIYYQIEKMPDITLKIFERKNDIDFIIGKYYKLYKLNN